MDVNGFVKDLLQRIVYVTVATSSRAGDPWNSPVFGAYDSNFNFYWGSHHESQHSQNIRDTGRAFIVVYDSTVPPGMGEGFYVNAAAKELNEEDDILAAHSLLVQRRPTPYWPLDAVSDRGRPIRLYKAMPRRAWVNTGVEVDGVIIDARQEVDLAVLHANS